MRPRPVSDLFDDYEEEPSAVRTCAPFLYEGRGKLSLHFDTAGVQSLMDIQAPERLMLGYTRTMMGFLAFQDRPRHLGIVGLGGGSLPKYCYKHLPDTRITVAEISPEVIAVRDRFFIPDDNHRFQVVCEDGAEFVKRLPGQFDVLLIDGFDSGGQPPELCSEEFYHDCSRALTPSGILVVNICDGGRSMLIPRLRRAFQQRILVVNGEDSTNTIVFAGERLTSDHFAARNQGSVLRNPDDSRHLGTNHLLITALQDWTAALPV